MGPEGRMEHVGRRARVCLPSLDEGLRPAVQTRGEQTLWADKASFGAPLQVKQRWLDFAVCMVVGDVLRALSPGVMCSVMSKGDYLRTSSLKLRVVGGGEAG